MNTTFSRHACSIRRLAKDPVRVGEQPNLQQEAGIVGRDTSVVAAIPVIKRREVAVLIDTVIEGVFEGAWEDLFVELDQETRPR